MSREFTPAHGVQRLAGGTPPILSLQALRCGLDALAGVSPAQLQAKATALTGFFVECLDARVPGAGAGDPARSRPPRGADQPGATPGRTGSCRR